MFQKIANAYEVSYSIIYNVQTDAFCQYDYRYFRLVSCNFEMCCNYFQDNDLCDCAVTVSKQMICDCAVTVSKQVICDCAITFSKSNDL